MIRTDLALEAREQFPEDNVEIRGAVLTEKEEEGIHIIILDIKDERAAKALRKPIGKYITLEIDEPEEEGNKLSKVLEHYIRQISGDMKNRHVMVVGLGNRQVTPDALGPKVIDDLLATRHLVQEYGKEFKDYHGIEVLSALAPGVMAQTGMETLEILQGITEKTKPDFLIVIDALAARSTKRLNRTLQLTNTGIHPGAGVGNNRRTINQESLGIPVIAIGVPTVVDAGTIVEDRLSDVLVKEGFSEEERGQFLREVDSITMRNLFVTPKDIDEAVEQMSHIIANALNHFGIGKDGIH